MIKDSDTIRDLHFVQRGLLGFEAHLDYSLSIYDPQTPFYWLRAKDDSELAFLVVEPRLLVDDYSFDLPDEEAKILSIHESEHAFVLVLLTIPENPMEMTANLLGPLIFNQETNQGRQVVLDHQVYSLRTPVFNTDTEGKE